MLTHDFIEQAAGNVADDDFIRGEWVNTSRLRRNDWHFADNILKLIFLYEYCSIFTQISLKFLCKGSTPASVQIIWLGAGPVVSHYLNQWWPRPRWVHRLKDFQTWLPKADNFSDTIYSINDDLHYLMFSSSLISSGWGKSVAKQAASQYLSWWPGKSMRLNSITIPKSAWHFWGWDLNIPTWLS